MDECGLEVIATAHTANDVAETVLLNLARGAGLRGLAGIPPVRGRVVRPLIENRRTEILSYLTLLEQPYRADPTNLTPKYARNRVRLEVLPILEELHPGAAGNMARSAALLRDDLEALEVLAISAVLRRGHEVFVPLDKLGSLHTALQRLRVARFEGAQEEATEAFVAAAGLPAVQRGGRPLPHEAPLSRRG